MLEDYIKMIVMLMMYDLKTFFDMPKKNIVATMVFWIATFISLGGAHRYEENVRSMGLCRVLHFKKPDREPIAQVFVPVFLLSGLVFQINILLGTVFATSMISTILAGPSGSKSECVAIMISILLFVVVPIVYFALFLLVR